MRKRWTWRDVPAESDVTPEDLAREDQEAERDRKEFWERARRERGENDASTR